MDRLTTLLDEEGDGRVSYRSLLGMLVRHLGDWTKRAPEVRLEYMCCQLDDLTHGAKRIPFWRNTQSSFP